MDKPDQNFSWLGRTFKNLEEWSRYMDRKCERAADEAMEEHFMSIEQKNNLADSLNYVSKSDLERCPCMAELIRNKQGAQALCRLNACRNSCDEKESILSIITEACKSKVRD